MSAQKVQLVTAGSDGGVGGPGGTPLSSTLQVFGLAAVQALASSNISSLSGLPVVDSYQTVSGDRLLLTGQTTASQNGIWQVAAGAWARPTDFAPTTVITGSRTVNVVNGSIYAGSTFLLSTSPVTVDTTSQTWQESSISGLQAANPLIPTSVKTTTVSAQPGDFIPVDASAGSVPVNLPNAPADRTRIGVKMIATAGSFTAALACGGSDVFNKAGGSTTLTLTAVFQSVLLQYSAATGIWYVQATDPASSVAIVASANTFTAAQTIRVAANQLLTLDNSSLAPGSANGKMIVLNPIAGAFNITMQHDYSSDTTGSITQDLMDLEHKSAGDAIFVKHKGGYMPGRLTTGSVATNDGITWIANQQAFSGAAQNGVQIVYNTTRVDTGCSITGTTTLNDASLVAGDNGRSVSGTGIPGGTTISAVVPGVSATLSQASTNGTGLTVTLGLSQALGVSGSGSIVTVNLATDGSGNATSTAAQVVTACATVASVNNIARAYLAVTSTNDANNYPLVCTGTGVMAAMAATNLAGAFTGTGLGAMTAFNCWAPLFNDDLASDQGTVVSYKTGYHAIAVTNLNPYSVGASIQVAHRAAGPAVKVTNQFTGAAGSAPSSPADGAGQLMQLNDYSTADTITIQKNTVPVAQSFTGFPTSKGAVIYFNLQTGTSTYPVFFSQRSGDSLGFRINNDGTASFGRTSSPTNGKFWIESTNAGAVTQLLSLNNTDNTTGAGVGIQFETANAVHAGIFSALTDASNSQLEFKLLAGGTYNGFPLILSSPAASGGNTTMKATWADGLNMAFGTTNGTKLGTATTHKIGFWNTTPIAQPTRAGQLTDNSGGASGGTTIAAVVASANDATGADLTTTKNAIATLAAKINAIEAKLSTAGGGVGITA